jgi:signal transduction histidine kinase
MRDLSQEHDLAEQVRRSGRLAILGEMVATVTHEIRSPLALIGGFARQVAKEPGLNEKAQHKLEIIIQEVGRLESILNELGDLSRPQKYNWQEIDLGQVVAHVGELMDPQLKGQKCKLTVIRHPNLPLIMADRDRLSQVLINLLNNAMQAGEGQPQVEVEVGPNGAGGVLLEVRDQGGGILPQIKDKLFTPFFTTKEGGTGLGLPVARRIVEEHGGKIEMEDNDRGGATVRITLPGPPAVQQKLPL